jgi:hypothetical protein
MGLRCRCFDKQLLWRSKIRQQAGMTGDLTAIKISSNGTVSVKGKGKYNEMSRLGAPKENAGFAKTQCSSIF